LRKTDLPKFQMPNGDVSILRVRKKRRPSM
jgi:hypothetical protein